MILADECRVVVKSEIQASDLGLNESQHMVVIIQMEFGMRDQAGSEGIRVGNLQINRGRTTVKRSRPHTRLAREVQLRVDGINYSVFNFRPECVDA